MQTITAYKYRIVNTKTKEPLISGDGFGDTVDMAKLLDEFSSFMERTQLSGYSQKVLSLKKNRKHYIYSCRTLHSFSRNRR